MKKFLTPFNVLITIVITVGSLSCKKDKDNGKPVEVNKVVITGDQYETITIANQTWTTANYKGPGGVFYDAANTRPEYGKFYSNNEVKAIVLPSGWRIPSVNDFMKLGQSQGIIFTDFRAVNQEASKKLVSVSRWLHVKGNNQSGFNAYPAGYIYNDAPPIEGDLSEFWTSEGKTFSLQQGGDPNSLRLLFYSNSNNELYKFNVRFVRDN